MENEPEDGRMGETNSKQTRNGRLINGKGEFIKIEVVIFQKAIDREIKEGSVGRFENASVEEAVGTVATHER